MLTDCGAAPGSSALTCAGMEVPEQTTLHARSATVMPDVPGSNLRLQVGTSYLYCSVVVGVDKLWSFISHSSSNDRKQAPGCGQGSRGHGCHVL